MSDLRFLSFVRQGIGASRQAATSVGVSMRVQGQSVLAPIQLYGPADIAAVDQSMIVRREPAPGSTASPPNHLAYVEFWRADFPWLLSAAMPDAHQRLQPWLCLVVVEAADGRMPAPQGNHGLPVLVAEARELPSLDELHGWAHVQITGPFSVGENMAAVLRTAPDRVTARLVCPRRLAPAKRYLAALVPATKAGRLAGVGRLPQRSDAQQPAWAAGDGSVTLPVYDWWGFQTSEAGDFETLARRLRPRDLGPAMIPWPMKLQPVAGDRQPTETALPSALMALNAALSWTGESRDTATEQLRSWLEAAAGGTVPRLGPPLYGSSQALLANPSDPDRNPRLPDGAGWLRDLNLDARFRAVANLGAELVRQHQEKWVAELSRQLGDVSHVNRLISGAALARLVGQRAHRKHIASLPPASIVAMTRPAWARLRVGETSVLAKVAASRVGASVLEGAYRRILRTRAARASLASVVERRNIQPTAVPTAPVARGLTRAAIDGRLRRPGHPRVPAVNLSEPVQAIRSDLAAAPLPAVPVKTIATPRQLQIAGLAQAVTASLAPADAAPRRLRTRIQAAGALPQLSTLQPIVAAPEIAAPLSDVLVAWDPRFFAPGIGAVPTDSVGYLKPEPAFIEALLVGANHELARELAWRGMPTDPRATLLRQFWPVDGALDRFVRRDIAPIADWPATTALGRAGLAADAQPGTIVVVRGEIARRFPDALYYTVKAVPDGTSRKPSDDAADITPPLFRGRLAGDTLYLGFKLDSTVLRGGSDDRGFYLVIQEHPGASRFGLDELDSGALATWMDLSWPRVALVDDHLSLAAAPPKPAATSNLTWGADAAQMAGILRRRTGRLCIHCADLLP